MTKRTCVILGLMLALVMLPAAAQARMWVGAQLGANFMADNDVNITLAGVGTIVGQNVHFDPSVIGGVIVGYDFVREGFLGYDYPAWMKYFSFAIDFTYNNANIGPQTVNVNFFGAAFPFGIPQARVSMPCLSFLFMGKYGFLPDAEVPFGRLQPYLAVGPGILFTTLDAGGYGVGKSSSADIALVVEAGIRYMALKNVSLDAIFRYRWAQPELNYTFAGVVPVNVDFDAHQFSTMFRVSYHF